jgi:hypothetical protein
MRMSFEVSRRRFIALLSAVTAIAAPPSHGEAPPQVARPIPSKRPSGSFPQTKLRKNVVAVQVKAYAWQDEGIEKLLDNLQEKGNVNTVYAFTYLSEPTDTSGKVPLPDHGTFGKNNPDHGGAYFDYDQKYFQNTFLKDFRSPDKMNVIAEAAPRVKARGMDFFAWDYNNTSAAMMRLIPGFTAVSEIDVYGRRTDSACFNHPDYRAHLQGRIEAYLLQYGAQVDGVIWGCERMGPLDNMIGGSWATTGISCFCEFCCAKARQRGISVDRARAGLIALDRLFAKAGRREKRPADGYFVEFWRTLLQYPEILSWHALWNDSYHEVRSELYGTGKSLAPEKPFGFHVMQNVTFSPFCRATEDYGRLQEYADFLKVASYNNAAGGRMARFVDRMCSTVFADTTPDHLMSSYYDLMGYQEASYEQIQKDGLSVRYLREETERAIACTEGKVAIYASVDIDVPVEKGEHHVTPQNVETEVDAAFDAGAQGVVLSREYTEMWLANLQAAGDATRRNIAQRGGG